MVYCVSVLVTDLSGVTSIPSFHWAAAEECHYGQCLICHGFCFLFLHPLHLFHHFHYGFYNRVWHNKRNSEDLHWKYPSKHDLCLKLLQTLKSFTAFSQASVKLRRKTRLKSSQQNCEQSQFCRTATALLSECPLVGTVCSSAAAKPQLLREDETCGVQNAPEGKCKHINMEESWHQFSWSKL